MGLDMYLKGRRQELARTKSVDGFPVDEEVLELGYWRKHPNLHGFIVEKFAEGIDDCNEIDLNVEELKTILEAVRKDELPHTEGFFFGKSQVEDKEPTIKVLESAIAWLEKDELNIIKTVYYRASW